MRGAMRQHQHRKTQPQASQRIRLWVYAILGNLQVWQCSGQMTVCTYNCGTVHADVLSCRDMVGGMVSHNKAPAG